MKLGRLKNSDEEKLVNLPANCFGIDALLQLYDKKTLSCQKRKYNNFVTTNARCV